MSERRNAGNRVECPSCGALLGTFTRTKTVLYASPGCAVFTPIGAAHAELICKSCGTLRRLRGKRLHGVVVQQDTNERP